jgi:Mor family transcriptional regulator
MRGGAFQHLVDGIAYGMVLFYIGQSTPTSLVTDHTPTKHRRNEDIRARYAQGETVVSLAEAFGISQQRVSQILRGKRK